MHRLALLPVLFASACIGSITGGEDDPLSPTPPTEPDPVTLTVRDGTRPVQGVRVLFLAPDDRLVADTTTDASGVATAKLPEGGTVTAIRTYPQAIGEPAAPPDRLWTYTAVAPGDALELAGPSRDDTLVMATITVGLTGGELVYITSPCGAGYGHAPSIPIELKGCGGQTDFFVINYTGETDPVDGTNSGPLYFVTRAAVAPAIDLSSGEFRGTLSTQYSASNMGGMERVLLQKRLVTADGFAAYDTGPIESTTLTVDLPELPSTEGITTAHVQAGGKGQQISSREAFSSAPVTLDVAANLIKTSSAPQLAGSILSWTEDGARDPDLSLATITVGAVDRRFVRTIAARYTGASLHVPALPAPHDKYNVKPSDTPRIDHAFARVTGGVDAVRARVFNRPLADLAPSGGMATATAPAITKPDGQNL